MDDKAQKAVDDIMSGRLVESLQMTGKYVAGGILIGLVVGYVVATLTGKCRMCLPFWAAVIGGSSGYLVANKDSRDKNKNACGCL
ncbi:MAG: hypothetical protein UT61_C0025G0016 [Candidatus Woesebacteria bacterium GW2011_GWA1_39_8]|uniref:Uncharacterized protein n=1 Tax=Candidatus Woesebacteria bacterium GW2011_GWA1_39_8 TaxID=1618552 RepID=A0A0G0PN98_9BACT|nr:MAG: hypothetical protein UT61_C0025G0016 [Candidatus Woesebacteria bacterium GW2011_GWA1_39_8]